MNTSGHPIFADPEFQPKRRKRAPSFGPEEAEYQPGIHFLDPLGEQAAKGCKPFAKLQHSPGVA